MSCVVCEMYHSWEIEKQMDRGFIASVLINCSDRRVEGCRAGERKLGMSHPLKKSQSDRFLRST